MTDLAASAPPANDFFHAVLAAAINATDAVAGAVWSIADGGFRLEQQLGMAQLGFGEDRSLQKLHDETLIQLGRQLDQPDAAIPERNLAGMLFRFYPCRQQGQAFLVIELVHAPGSNMDADFQDRLMSAIAEITGDFRNSRLLNQLRFSDRLWHEFYSILPRLHAGIALKETAYRIANEGRRFLGCDRLSVARCRGKQATILAVSGVAVLERRARQIRELQLLIAEVANSGYPLRFPADRDVPPQREVLLRDYLDSSGCEQLFIIPFQRILLDADEAPHTKERPFGSLVIECFSTSDHSQLARKTELFFPQANLALQNACEFAELPLLPASLWLRSLPKALKSRGFKLLGGLTIAASGVICAVLIPADLSIDAKGTFEPHEVHHVYAPVDGEIVEVRAVHQDKVLIGQPLISMRSRELELRKEELMTQRGVTLEKLRSIEAARLRDRKSSSAESMSAAELSANELELKEVLGSQTEQLNILQEMLAALELQSPISGSVISWNPLESLERRPVQQGQKLLSVAELEGRGRLQLRVLDTDIQHVVAARQRESSALDVKFTLASNPGHSYRAVVQQLGTRVETLSQDGASVRVEAVVESGELQNARPGATVFAKINCGRSNLAYVWTRRLLDFFWLHLF